MGLFQNGSSFWVVLGRSWLAPKIALQFWNVFCFSLEMGLEMGRGYFCLRTLRAALLLSPF